MSPAVIGAQGNGIDHAVGTLSHLAEDLAHFFFCPRIPHADDLVTRARYQVAAIGTDLEVPYHRLVAAAVDRKDGIERKRRRQQCNEKRRHQETFQTNTIFV